MNREIGDRFVLTMPQYNLPDTHAVLEVVGDGGCARCYLHGWCSSNYGKGRKETTGECLPSRRGDGKYVSFKFIEWKR